MIIDTWVNDVVPFLIGWIDLSDHAEISKLIGPNAAYAVFAGVLCVWDLFPTAVVLFLFRLRRPQFIGIPGSSQGGAVKILIHKQLL